MVQQLLKQKGEKHNWILHKNQAIAAKAQWFPIDKLAKLTFDHEDIMRDATGLRTLLS